MNDDELSNILRRTLATLKVGVDRDGVYLQESNGFYRLRAIIAAVRESDSNAVTDDAWHLLRGVEDTLPELLAKTPHLASAAGIRDTKEQLAAIIADLRLRLVVRTMIESEWVGKRSLDADLCLLVTLDGDTYSYSGQHVEKDGKPRTLHVLLPHKTYEEAIALNASAALYRVVDMPRIAWRTFEDGIIVLGEKCGIIRAYAREKGEFPYIASKLQVN